MIPFDRVVIADWSAAAAPSPKQPSANAIWIACADTDGSCQSRYFRTRHAAEEHVRALLDTDRRTLLGFDFAFGYPGTFARDLTRAPADAALALWDLLRNRIQDDEENANNRFDVAARINAALPGIGPFWNRPSKLDLPDLPVTDDRSDHGYPDLRMTDDVADARPQTVWKLYTAGAVGGQSLVGLPMLARLRARYGTELGVWPMQDDVLQSARIVVCEVYPGLIEDAVKVELQRGGADVIKDDVQVRALAGALSELQQAGALQEVFAALPDDPRVRDEGWILGVGAEPTLRAAARAALRPDLVPPRLSNDCFALPQGVDWTPVDVALQTLSDRLHPVVGAANHSVRDAQGRVLARDAVARRANPPAANSAVDGYGFRASDTGRGRQVLPLVDGRAAAGAPFQGAVPGGQAIRILTGALVPAGVDTVVLEEDTRVQDGHIAFDGPVKPGANTRKAGEDVAAGATALSAGRVLTAADIALLSALGVPDVDVFNRLRVGVLSTGDELAPSGETDDPSRTYDANRPMLLALAERWAHAPVDLGHVGDDRDALRQALNEAAGRADVILTSGGASAGDEDHVSALLAETGALQKWRIALKPGRPLAIALWDGVPVFGLPGNPVAAFVCALIFARPAMQVMSGARWTKPQAFQVPAAFEKRKKPGRREYLRARLNADGHAEVFRSEGSGRISGISWAEGLVELGDEARHVKPGDAVAYIPFGSFGL